MSMAAAPSGSFSSETCPAVSRCMLSKDTDTTGTGAPPPALPSDETAATLAAENLSSSPPTAVAAAALTTTVGAALCLPLGCKGTLPIFASGSLPSKMSRLRSISSWRSYCRHVSQSATSDDSRTVRLHTRIQPADGCVYHNKMQQLVHFGVARLTLVVEAWLLCELQAWCLTPLLQTC